MTEVELIAQERQRQVEAVHTIAKIVTAIYVIFVGPWWLFMVWVAFYLFGAIRAGQIKSGEPRCLGYPDCDGGDLICDHDEKCPCFGKQ